MTSPPARKTSGLCRWVKICGASGNHAMILSFVSFSLKYKRNLCSVELWNFQLQRIWPLPLLQLHGSPRGGRSVVLVYQRLVAFQSAITRQSGRWMSMLKKWYSQTPRRNFDISTANYSTWLHDYAFHGYFEQLRIIIMVQWWLLSIMKSWKRHLIEEYHRICDTCKN